MLPLRLLTLVVLILALVAASQSQNVINRQQGNVLQNLTKTHQYQDNIVTSSLDASNPIRFLYRGLREVYSRILSGTGQRNTGEYAQPKIPANQPFPCSTKGFRSQIRPTSVHQLRPGDIDIIAALGDSLTSATAANSQAIWEVLVENRGLSWCIGGQETWRTILTVPNIMKEFNPNLFGYSLEDSYNVHRSAQFNVAENIATTSDMPYNAEKLMNRMKLDPRVDWNNHWKLLTLMIGGNDFCSDVCYQTNATQWINRDQERYLIKTLRFLRDNMPRTLINLVPSPLLSLQFSTDGVKDVPFTCSLSRPIECSCLYGPVYSSQRNLYRKLERNFVKIMERVSYMKEFHTNDFTVVYQPFFKDARVTYEDTKIIDMKMLSIDCVHFSQKGHAVSANGLWNNMLEPVGHKSLGFRTLFKEFRCPSSRQPYIYTNYNSR